VTHLHGGEDDAEDARWLALTCEVEREAPALLELLGVRPSGPEEVRLDAIVREGDEASFLEWLRETRAALEATGPAPGEATRLAEVLAEVYLLLPGLRAPEPPELDELRRLRALAA
jgi:hypothetical protein